MSSHKHKHRSKHSDNTPDRVKHSKMPIQGIPNDGSFLERFKKMQEAKERNASSGCSSSQQQFGFAGRTEIPTKNKSPPPAGSSSSYQTTGGGSTSEDKWEQKQSVPTPTGTEDGCNKMEKPKTSMISKRRIGGNRVLKTGVVEKKMKPDDNETGKDGVSRYMSELEKYKMVCTSEETGRPLIK